MIRSDTLAGGVGGVVIGYILWLAAISIANAATTVSRWSPMVLMLSGAFAVCSGAWAWRLRRQHRDVGAAFALGLPILPVILTLGVLTDTFV